MITAKQAIEIANEANGDTKSFRELLSKIRVEAGKGAYETFWYEVMTDIQKKRLIDAGYIVTGAPDRDGYFYRIEWRVVNQVEKK